MGYATYYTTAPVLSLVLDVELPEKVVFMFPELYQTLRNGRALSIKSFFGWVWRSIYQVHRCIHLSPAVSSAYVCPSICSTYLLLSISLRLMLFLSLIVSLYGCCCCLSVPCFPVVRLLCLSVSFFLCLSTCMWSLLSPLMSLSLSVVFSHF